MTLAELRRLIADGQRWCSELDFILNSSIKYRMGRDASEDEEV